MWGHLLGRRVCWTEWTVAATSGIQFILLLSTVLAELTCSFDDTMLMLKVNSFICGSFWNSEFEITEGSVSTPG